MQNFGKSWFWLPYMVAISAISIQAVYAQPSSPARGATTKVGNVPVDNVLQRLGAKLEGGITAKELDGYSSHFDRTDPDRDGKHTRAEYVDKGNYMTPQARAGIFRAADGNADGVVTKAEYVLNRIITDEAKAIVQGMDDDKDGLVERAEFVKHAAKLLLDLDLAKQVYAALDANADGGIPIPEYLRVWGQWARAGRKSAEERIAAQRSVEGKVQPAPKNCPACAMGLTAEFVLMRTRSLLPPSFSAALECRIRRKPAKLWAGSIRTATVRSHGRNLKQRIKSGTPIARNPMQLQCEVIKTEMAASASPSSEVLILALSGWIRTRMVSSRAMSWANCIRAGWPIPKR